VGCGPRCDPENLLYPLLIFLAQSSGPGSCPSSKPTEAKSPRQIALACLADHPAVCFCDSQSCRSAASCCSLSLWFSFLHPAPGPLVVLPRTMPPCRPPERLIKKGRPGTGSRPLAHGSATVGRQVGGGQWSA
jgi:hypothetical protein